jgi:hypothetical protein
MVKCSSDDSKDDEQLPWPLERIITPLWIRVNIEIVPYTKLYEFLD